MIVYQKWYDVLGPFRHLQYATAEEFYKDFSRWTWEWMNVVERMSALLGEDDLLFQHVPTFRILEAWEKPRYDFHSDTDVGHNPHIINLWVPLTEVGPGTLVVASHNTKTMLPGECVIFPGADVHGATIQPERRVSFDARFLPYHRYEETSAVSDVYETPLTLGHYYGRYQR